MRRRQFLMLIASACTLIAAKPLCPPGRPSCVPSAPGIPATDVFGAKLFGSL
jgi:hypothetical protein